MTKITIEKSTVGQLHTTKITIEDEPNTIDGSELYKRCVDAGVTEPIEEITFTSLDRSKQKKRKGVRRMGGNINPTIHRDID